MNLTSRAREALALLLEGNRRFREGRSHHHIYSPEELLALSKRQVPKAAIVACSDSRVAPEVIFDQPLGSIFSSRVPGNVGSDSVKWMLDLAIQDFQVPLVIVLGHTGCLAVGSLLDGDKGGAGGLHRFTVLGAIYRAKSKQPDDLYVESVEQNALQTVEHLIRDSFPLRAALLDGKTSILAAVYEMDTGAVRTLESPIDLYGRF